MQCVKASPNLCRPAAILRPLCTPRFLHVSGNTLLRWNAKHSITSVWGIRLAGLTEPATGDGQMEEMRRSGGWFQRLLGLVGWRSGSLKTVALATAIILLITVAAGGLFRFADRQLRQDLVQQAVHVAKNLNTNLVGNLSGTSEDQSSPYYRQLKDELAAISAANPQFRHVYVMGNNSAGQVFFYACNQPVGHELEAPAGAIYHEMPSDFRTILEMQQPSSVGPYTDRWGWFVSAAAPIFAADTGEMLGVLALDVEYHTWRWQILYRAAPPLALALIVLSIVAAFYIISHSVVDSSPKLVLRRVFLPLAVIIVGLVATVLLGFWTQYRHQHRTEFNGHANQVYRELQVDLANQGQGLCMLLVPLASDPNIPEDISRKDVDALQTKWLPVFEQLNRSHNITHMYFYDISRTCLLRLHNIDRRGDVINRYTLLQAEATRQPTFGVETGPLSTLTLRAVQPLMDGRQIIGYIEVGKEVDDVFQVRCVPGIELAIVLQKQTLVRDTWQNNMRSSQLCDDWDLMPDSAAVFCTMGRLPGPIAKLANTAAADSPAVGFLETELEGRPWLASALPLHDASAQHIGSLIVAADVSVERAAFARAAALIGTLAAAAITVLLCFVYVLLRRADLGIRAQQAKLRQSERRHSATLRSIGDGVIVCDISGKITSINGVAEQLTGWNNADAHGQPVAEVLRIVHYQTRLPAEMPVDRTLRENRTVALAEDTALLRRGGGEFHIADSCAPIHDSDGTLIGAVLVFRDVTEEFSRDLRQQFELRFQKVVTTASSRFICCRDHEFDPSVTQVLSDLGKLFGIQRALLFRTAGDLSTMDNTHEWCSKSSLSVQHMLRDMPAARLPWMKSQLARLEPFAVADVQELPQEAEVDQALFQQQGVRSLICLPMRNHCGEPIGFLCLHEIEGARPWSEQHLDMLQVVADIIGGAISRRETAKAVQASKARLRAITDSAQDAILMMDEHGLITFWNPAAQTILGYERDEAIGRSLHDMLAPERYYAPQLAAMDNFHRSGCGPAVGKTTELAAICKDGREISVSLSLSSVMLNGKWHAVGILRDTTDRKAMEEALRTAARTDKLTGLPNRALFCDRLQQAILRSNRLPNYHFAVLFLDFDRFKTINDSLGHDAGDQLLKEIAIRLQATVRTGDSLAAPDQMHVTSRFGGDEFVVLLDGLDSTDSATAVAQRMLETFAQPYQLGEHRVVSTASIGIVTSDMKSDSAEMILRDADTAMYEAKLAGKGRYVHFDVSMQQRVQKCLALEIDLRQAMDNDEFFLVYQPIVSLQTGSVKSFEALLRWQHPREGLISPADFIPIAEETGLIIPIGEWVLREACRQFMHWRSVSPKRAPECISVNLSRRQLVLPDLPQKIRQIIDETAMDASRLHLEVTESAVMDNADQAARILAQIKAINVKLAMDDFGTGHSSLACLHQFPFDILKIDRSFVASIDSSRDFAALAHAVIQLARNLDIDVIAEGIETLQQVLMLQSLACESGQGYFFSKPLEAAKVLDFKVQQANLPGMLV